MNDANKKSKLKILIVDDEPEIGFLISVAIEKTYEPILATSAEDALPLIDLHASELVCVISDFKMSGINGMELRREMLKKYKDIPFVLLSGHITRDDALTAIDVKISAFEEKPCEDSRLLEIIERVTVDRESIIRERMMLEQTFIEEATTICEELESLIMSLESNPSDMENLNTIFRLVHTIKGSSGVLESTHIRTYVHNYEDVLSKLKSAQIIATPDVVSILLQGFDVVNRMIAHLRAGKKWEENVDNLAKIFDIGGSQARKDQGEVQKAGQANAAHGAAKESVSVPTAMLDRFMEQSGEITVIRNMVNKLVRVIEKEQPGNKNIQQLGELLDEMHKINGGMQNRLTETRKVPCTKVFRSIPRIVRDTAGALGKKVNLTILGDETRVDTAIAKVLSDSMTHIVRNSLDHGIEMPDVRVANGKPKEGSVIISTREQKDEIIVTIQDDGAGLNVDRIKRKAVERGLYKEEELGQLPEKSIYSIIFDSGFSTAEKVTDVSGRGVGMDMVRSAVQSVHGFIDIESAAGQGTKFHLHLPIPKSVLIISSLSVVAENMSFAIPQEKITRLIRFDGERVLDSVHELQGGYAIHFDGALIPVIDLGTALKLRESQEVQFRGRDSLNFIVISSVSGYYALFVDAILDSEEIVVKSAGKHLTKLKVYVGATFMADGNVGLILNTDGIAEVARVASAAQANADSRQSAVKDQAANDSRSVEYLMFDLFCEGKFAVPLEMVHRLEEISQTDIQKTGDRLVAIYREQIIPLVDLTADFMLPSLNRDESTQDSKLSMFVVLAQKHYVGFLIRSIRDIATVQEGKIYDLSDRPQLSGTIEVGREIISVVDLQQILRRQKLVSEADSDSMLVEDMKIGPESAEDRKVTSNSEQAANQGWGIF